MIEEGSDGDARDKLGNAAGVVGVVMGDEDVVDLAETRLLGGGDDAVRVTAVLSGPARVDEERLVLRGDEERGLAAFYVDEVDAQCFALCAERGLDCAGEDQPRDEGNPLQTPNLH